MIIDDNFLFFLLKMNDFWDNILHNLFTLMFSNILGICFIITSLMCQLQFLIWAVLLNYFFIMLMLGLGAVICY